MSSAPRHSTASVPYWRPAAQSAPPAPTPAPLAAPTAIDEAHTAFRDVLLGLGASLPSAAFCRTLDAGSLGTASDRWMPRLLRAASLAFGPGGSDIPSAARHAGTADLSAHAAVHAAATAYACALRHDGVALPAALVAVRAAVRDGAELLPPDVTDAVGRDVVRCCLAAFCAH